MKKDEVAEAGTQEHAARAVVWPRFMRRAARVLAGAYVVALITGAAVFLRRQPIIATPVIETHAALPTEWTNVASFQAGSTVRVSSFDVFRSHHPLFAVDGEEAPTALMKWATLARDSRPWLEVRFARPAEVRRVELVLSGAFEDAAFTVRDYSIQCLQNGRAVARAQVRANREPRPAYPMKCIAADSVRVDFTVPRGQRVDVVRLYEIVVWGRFSSEGP